jgi:hypothetical protein
MSKLGYSTPQALTGNLAVPSEIAQLDLWAYSLVPYMLEKHKTTWEVRVTETLGQGVTLGAWLETRFTDRVATIQRLTAGGVHLDVEPMKQSVVDAVRHQRTAQLAVLERELSDGNRIGTDLPSMATLRGCIDADMVRGVADQLRALPLDEVHFHPTAASQLRDRVAAMDVSASRNPGDTKAVAEELLHHYESKFREGFVVSATEPAPLTDYASTL